MISSDPILEEMDPVTLVEMSSWSLMNRVDTKYVFAVDRLPELLNRVGNDYRVLKVDGTRLAPYLTLYFDTPDRMCYMQHHNGQRTRRKIRMRQYVSSGTTFLEVKAKNNKGRTDKRRIPIDDIQDSLSPEAQAFVDAAAGERYELTPHVWSKFSRITMVHKRRPERVTLDLNLEFTGGEQPTSLPHVAIAEVKQESNNRHSPLREQLRQLKIRPMRVSKYCLGSVLLKPELKHNRFKRKLRVITNHLSLG